MLKCISPANYIRHCAAALLLLCMASPAAAFTSATPLYTGNSYNIAPAASLPPNICANTAGVASPYATCANPLIGTDTYVGARSDPGNAGGPIDEWGRCRYVDNISTSESLFVPFKAAVEWMAFTDHAPVATIRLAHCARPAVLPLHPDDRCLAPVAIGEATVNLPYARTGTILTETTTYQCTTYGICNDGTTATADSSLANCGAPKTWTETVYASFNALDSDVANPSWSQTVTFDGTAPVPNAAPLALCQSARDMLARTNTPSPVIPTATPFTISQSGNFGNQGMYNYTGANGNPTYGYYYSLVDSGVSNVVLGQPNTTLVLNGNNNQNINVATTAGLVVINGSGNTVTITGGATPVILNGSNNKILVTGSFVAVCSSGNNNAIASNGGNMSIESTGNNNSSEANGGTSIVIASGNGNNNIATGGQAIINNTGDNGTNTTMGGDNSITVNGNGSNNTSYGGSSTITTNGTGNNNTSTGGVNVINANP